jgi:hypothetical protein
MAPLSSYSNVVPVGIREMCRYPWGGLGFMLFYKTISFFGNEEFKTKTETVLMHTLIPISRFDDSLRQAEHAVEAREYSGRSFDFNVCRCLELQA